MVLTTLAQGGRWLHAQEAAPATLTAYQNYDFVPGEVSIFADDFSTTQDGEFPATFELKKGQGVVNKYQGVPALLLTDGNYAQAAPRLGNANYLPAQWTLEFDTYGVPGAYEPILLLNKGDDEADLKFTTGEVQYYYDGGGNGVDLNGTFPESVREDAYANHWHHVSIAVNGTQMKVYMDQFRILNVPDTKFRPTSLMLAGIGAQETPIVFANVRLASGGGMNLTGKKFTDAKIVTHGIYFDSDRATLRPESMGVLNQISKLMTSDTTLKFEIDGHTDNTGAAAHNLALSQQRADAVRAQLVSMGVDGSRLTTKGLGDTKPLGPNSTPEGKANNRRVEFVKSS